MSLQELFDGLRKKVGRAEGMGKGGFEGCCPIVAEAVREDKGDWRLACFVVKTAGFEAVLAVAVVDDRPLAFFSDDNNGTQEVVALGGGLLEESANREAVMEGSIVAAGSAIDFSGIRKARGSSMTRSGEKRDPACARFRSGLGELRERGRRDGEGVPRGDWEFVLVHKLVGETRDAHGVIRRLAADDKQVLVVGDGVLIVAAIAATSA